MASIKKHDGKQPANEQSDDTLHEQKSHGSQQNHSKKEGHATQIGSGQDQQSSHTGGRSQTRTKP